MDRIPGLLIEGYVEGAFCFIASRSWNFRRLKRVLSLSANTFRQLGFFFDDVEWILRYYRLPFWWCSADNYLLNRSAIMVNVLRLGVFFRV